MRILAGIVLYNPDIQRLKDNYLAIAEQVDSVVLVNNGSNNWEKIKDELSQWNVEIINNEENRGIATALHQIMEFGITIGTDWVITLDQDSVCRPGLIDAYKQWIHLDKAGILTCVIEDRNFSIGSGFAEGEKWKEIKQCITSASFISTEAYENTDGFDEKMFIDSVDFDICLNMRQHGYKIYRINHVGLLHEVGHGKNVKLLFKDYIVYNHSPLRNYYMARNKAYLVRKYPEYFSKVKEVIREVRSEVLILVYEESKIKKIRARWKGLRDVRKLVHSK